MRFRLNGAIPVASTYTFCFVLFCSSAHVDQPLVGIVLWAPLVLQEIKAPLSITLLRPPYLDHDHTRQDASLLAAFCLLVLLKRCGRQIYSTHTCSYSTRGPVGKVVSENVVKLHGAVWICRVGWIRHFPSARLKLIRIARVTRSS